MRNRFPEGKIKSFPREAKAGLAIAELRLRHSFSKASYYLWHSKFGAVNVSDANRPKEVETQNPRLKLLMAEASDCFINGRVRTTV